MELRDVPQEGNATLNGLRKAVYARDAQGKIVSVASSGWEVEEIVTLQALDGFAQLAKAAYARGGLGVSSPLEYWMYAQRMDVSTLAQTSGIWVWRIRRHFKPLVFTGLSISVLERYAHSLGLSVQLLRSLPSQP
jgi:hypothetical protein